MRHQSSEELNSCGRDGRVGRGSSEQLLAAGSNRGRLMPSRSDAGRAARACAKCDNRRQMTDVSTLPKWVISDLVLVNP